MSDKELHHISWQLNKFLEEKTDKRDLKFRLSQRILPGGYTEYQLFAVDENRNTYQIPKTFSTNQEFTTWDALSMANELIGFIKKHQTVPVINTLFNLLQIVV